MFLNLISFLVSFSLLLITFTLIFKTRKNNYFFLFILFFAGSQRFFYGLNYFKFIEEQNFPLNQSLIYVALMPPVYFLFLKNLLVKITSFKENIIHLVFSFVVIVHYFSVSPSQKASTIIFLTYSSVYLFSSIYIMLKKQFKRKNLQEREQFNSVKNWVYIMFFLFVALWLFANYLSLFNIENKKIVLGQFYSYTALIWAGLVIYLKFNPIIVYGKELLIKENIKIEKENFKIWNIKPLKKTEEVDINIEKSANYTIIEIIENIKNYEKSILKDFKKTPSIKDIALEIDKPQNHVKYCFKYFCNYSFTNYCHVLRIKYAIQLIDEGFLKTNTIESLSEKCLYNSRVTFFNNFKKIIGINPTEYLKKNKF